MNVQMATGKKGQLKPFHLIFHAGFHSGCQHLLLFRRFSSELFTCGSRQTGSINQVTECKLKCQVYLKRPLVTDTMFTLSSFIALSTSLTDLKAKKKASSANTTISLCLGMNPHHGICIRLMSDTHLHASIRRSGKKGMREVRAIIVEPFISQKNPSDN